jgi:hypothetical protein
MEEGVSKELFSTRGRSEPRHPHGGCWEWKLEME